MVKHVKIQIITVQTLGHLTDQILKICKIHRKWRVKQTSVLFCKYLRNQISDLYEIWNLSSVHTSTHRRGKRARARRNVRAHVFTSCARMCARIFTKSSLLFLDYAMNLSLKFHKDQSFACGDIYKTKLMFV